MLGHVSAREQEPVDKMLPRNTLVENEVTSETSSELYCYQIFKVNGTLKTFTLFDMNYTLCSPPFYAPFMSIPL